MDSDLLDRRIAEKHDCLCELRDMGERQLELVHAGAVEGLLDVLAAKQRVLARLQKIERDLDPFRKQDDGRRTWRSEEARRRCARRLEECESLLAEIVGQEKESQDELTRRRDQVASQLEDVHQALRARGAYAAPPQQGAGQLDLLSEA